MTRSEESLDGSSIGAAPFAQILLRFVDDPIKATSLNIGFKLSVPFLCVELSEPGAKRGSLFNGKSSDGFFDLLNRAHISHAPKCPSKALVESALSCLGSCSRWLRTWGYPHSNLGLGWRSGIDQPQGDPSERGWSGIYQTHVFK